MYLTSSFLITSLIRNFFDKKLIFLCGSFIAKSTGVASQNKGASLTLLSKEANTKDTQLKSQLLLSFKDDDPSKGSENIWPQFGFFGEKRLDLTILKANFPELTLCYINQAHVSVVKGGEKALYCDIILGQIMPLANIDPLININTYEPEDNEAVIYVPMYNTETGLYYGLSKELGLITLRGDAEERFFSYGFNKEKSALLYCTMKTALPTTFTVTCFQKHKQLLLDQNELGAKQSDIFFFLPATFDRKENFLQ